MGVKFLYATAAGISAFAAEYGKQRVLVEELATQRRADELLEARTKLHELQQIRDALQLVDPPTDTEQVRIGHEVDVELNGVRHTYIVAGYGEGDPNSKPQKVNYDIAVIRAIMGKPVRYMTTVKRDGTEVDITVKAIRFPKQDAALASAA